MYIKVQLLSGFSEYLWYAQPDEWHQSSLIGSLIRVPLRNAQVPALVIDQQRAKPAVDFIIRTATAIEAVPADPHYQKFINQLSIYYQINPIVLIKRIKQFLYQKEMKSIPVAPQQTNAPTQKVTLTAAQQKISATLNGAISTPRFMPSLLHGVTGSGKTEIYKTLMQSAVAHKKTTLFLLPEVTLALAFAQRLQQEAPELPLFNFHSATSAANKRTVWNHLLAKTPIVIIGVHLPVLLPIANLGLIIIDEEHETGYQEKKHPKINSKQAALMRAKINDIPILLGSATPSLTSLYMVKQKKWHFFQLTDRFTGTFPTIITVLLTDKKKRKHFWISKQLQDALKECLANNQQALIFLNRRGHSFFVQCKSCSHTFTCPSCSVSLTLHTNQRMHCHYCDYKTDEPKQCPECTGTTFLRKGIGTQQAVTILEKLFPDARIARADLDSTKKKKEWEQTLNAMHAGTIDILVGTQTITKGYHFPRVTLVGILWADLQLHFPLFNAAETTLQQLIQVGGRAGRNKLASSVIVQTMDNHPIFQFLNERAYLSFYKQEVSTRAMLGYPPTGRLVELELKNNNEATLEKEAHAIANLLQTVARRLQLNVEILGPAKPPVHKIKNWYSRKMYLKAARMQEIITLYKHAKKEPLASMLYFTPQPTR